MSLLTEAIRGHASSFDDKVYPTDVYYHLLNRVRDATSPDDLGSALVHLLAWKDGKVQRDPQGPHRANGNRRYRVTQTKPNTSSERHETVLKSDVFFKWASTIRTSSHFDSSQIESLQEQFPLWKTIVLPVFVLHCLRPHIYPIVDRYVMVVFNALRPAHDSRRFSPARITVDAYDEYHDWWLQLLKEAEIPQLHAELNELKDIDSGLWALGRSMLRQATELKRSDDDDGAVPAPRRELIENPNSASVVAAAPPVGTDSREFKARAIALWMEGRTQSEAIKTAATELAITLKPSYSAYPGSHFDRWRRQGFWTKEK